MPKLAVGAGTGGPGCVGKAFRGCTAGLASKLHWPRAGRAVEWGISKNREAGSAPPRWGTQALARPILWAPILWAPTRPSCGPAWPGTRSQASTGWAVACALQAGTFGYSEPHDLLQTQPASASGLSLGNHLTVLLLCTARDGCGVRRDGAISRSAAYLAAGPSIHAAASTIRSVSGLNTVVLAQNPSSLGD